MADTPDDGPVRLTEYADLHGCSCKVGQGELDSLLGEAGLTEDRDELLFGVGEDAAARRLTDDLALVSTVDFFTPIVDDPYDFGRVAACNAASDAFATGATENLDCLVVLGLPRAVTEAAPAILAGITDAIDRMGGVVAGGHTITNPWPFAGGAVSATAAPEDLLTSRGATPGDRLYLTKPLGTQSAMGALRVSDDEFGDLVRETAGRPVERIGNEALAWMTTPNRDAAAAARGLATAATDVTGFGLAGQARVLAENSGVGVEVTRLPVVAGSPELSRLFGYGLEDGESAETSGGLLLSVPDERAADLEARLDDAGVFYWRVGRVTEGSGVALSDPTIERISR
ncbi:selenide, water dikinase SelD [Halostella sp. JP-L12]|uniref:selenide, water dikinase SelD n=1 Tax=Halostella TaxID=1843185 RepID=UPI000EF85154|nr:MULTISPECIES: selenide, water dikinase SelD [Halostella]NHN49095.1 selenide, water dikinase SelD [Halostella sp. JP-L12]